MLKRQTFLLIVAIALVCWPHILGAKSSSSDKKDGAAATGKAGKKPAPGSAAKKDKPETDAPKTPAPEYLVEVYPLPIFCISKSEAAGAGVQRISPPTMCGDNQLTVPAGNAADIATALNSDADYSVVAFGTDTVVIYSKAKTAPKATGSHPRLDLLKAEIESLAKPPYKYVELIRVPFGSAAGTAPLVESLNTAGISAEAVGFDHLLLKSSMVPDGQSISDVRIRIESMGWQRPSAPPTQRLFYLDAEKTLKSLAGGGSDASSDKTSDTGGGPKSGKKSAGGSKASGGDKGADKTASKSGDPAAGKDAKTGEATDDKTKPSDAPAPLNVQAVTDTWVYSNADGGDEHISERSRIMTMLDLPRPEILMNLWSFQASSKDYNVVNADSEAVREAVAHHNEVLQSAIENGWDYLSTQMKDAIRFDPRGFFNKEFYSYITQKFAFDPVCPPVEGEDLDQVKRNVKDSTAEKTGDSSGKESGQVGCIDPRPMPAVAVPRSHRMRRPGGEMPAPWKQDAALYAKQRRSWGWCDVNTYCLGFAHAFEPLRPTFTNILLAIAASNYPERTAKQTIQAMSGACSSAVNDIPASCPLWKQAATVPAPRDEDAANENASGEFHKCIVKGAEQIERTLNEEIDLGHRARSGDCELLDRLTLMRQLENKLPETLQLYCFQRQAAQSFQDGRDARATIRVGLLRAAIADFLFNYKMASQFPHDFVPYDLTQSAQELNAEFNPLILAFNRDVASFTQHLQTELQCHEQQNDKQSESWFGGGGNTFINDALISVRGISGVESLVDTVTQNYFDATKPPSITDLVQSVADAEKNLPGVLSGNLTANEAAVIVGALNSVHPAQAKIGRELTLDITPHSLAGASSAELEVKLTNQETGDPTRYESGKSSEDDLSRVAKHSTTTRVRVESLKLFEVSSFSAKLQRPRSSFPLIPPVFEVPYFGSFISFPVKGATQYHRSTAVVSAVIVPTAADLAFGIDFGADRVCGVVDADYGVSCHRAKSIDDFRGLPFRNFHKSMVQCFATGGANAYPGVRVRADLAKFLDRGDGKSPRPEKLNTESIVLPCQFSLDDVPPSE